MLARSNSVETTTVMDGGLLKNLSVFVSTIVAALCVTTQVGARPLTVAEKKSDFSQLVTQIESGYGPLQYKQEKKNIQLAALNDTYLKLIEKTSTNRDYYYLLTRFIAEFHDSHTSGSLPTTRVASTGLTVELVQGKVLIFGVDPALLPPASFSFQRGDEVTEIDGRDVNETIAELQAYVGGGYALTERAMATWLLFRRPATRVPMPTAPTVKVKIRRGTSDIIEDAELKWVFTGDELDEAAPTTQPLPPPRIFSVMDRGTDYDRLDIRGLAREFNGPSLDRSYMCNPTSRIAVPAGATKIMDTPFVAYYYPTAKGQIGYVRIPDYLPRNAKGEDASDERLRQYQYAINILESKTVGLIIDQDHNCGGSVSYLHQVLGLFMNKPFASTQFELRASKSSYLSFKNWMDQTPDSTLDHDNLKTVADLIKDSWDKGLFLTPKTSITGDQILYPNPINYTKPIIVLIDYLSGSGGDAFPAMIQGLGRAKLLGTRTMGAGGHVVEMPPLAFSAFTYRLTQSLFYRPDGVAIENNGAEPDYAYDITRDDVLYGYKPYQKFFTAKILELVN